MPGPVSSAYVELPTVEIAPIPALVMPVFGPLSWAGVGCPVPNLPSRSDERSELSVRVNDYRLIEPALDYLNRTYGMKPTDVQAISVNAAAGDVTTLNVTILVRSDELDRQQEEKLRAIPREVPLVRPSEALLLPQEKPVAFATCESCRARIWAYSFDENAPTDVIPFGDWRGCSERYEHFPQPIMIVPSEL